MADVELLPLPQPVVWITDESVDAIKSVHGKDSPYGIHGLTCKYAKCVNPLYSAETVDALQAENERLRAEVREAREFRDKMANAIGNDQLRRFIEKHGEPVPLTTRMQEAEARAERLAEALRPHIEDLERSAVVLDQYPAMAPTAAEMRKAAAELRAALHPTAAQAAENERLRAEVAEWKRVAAAQAELHGEAEARADRLVEALRWYAEQAQLCRKFGSEGDAARHALSADGGKRANRALAQEDRND